MQQRETAIAERSTLPAKWRYHRSGSRERLHAESGKSRQAKALRTMANAVHVRITGREPAAAVSVSGPRETAGVKESQMCDPSSNSYEQQQFRMASASSVAEIGGAAGDGMRAAAGTPDPATRYRDSKNGDGGRTDGICDN